MRCRSASRLCRRAPPARRRRSRKRPVTGVRSARRLSTGPAGVDPSPLSPSRLAAAALDCAVVAKHSRRPVTRALVGWRSAGGARRAAGPARRVGVMVWGRAAILSGPESRWRVRTSTPGGRTEARLQSLIAATEGGCLKAGHTRGCCCIMLPDCIRVLSSQISGRLWATTIRVGALHGSLPRFAEYLKTAVEVWPPCEHNQPSESCNLTRRC